MGEIKAIHGLPPLKDKVFAQNDAHKGKTQAHKVEETVDKGSSCTYENRSSGEYEAVPEK